MKKLFTLALAVLMIMAMAVPAMAAETTYSITINNSASGHTYEAYQIFDGDLLDTTDSDNGNSYVVLSNIVWGSGIDTTKEPALLAALNNEFGKTFENAKSVAGWLTSVTSDSTTLDAFAEVVGDYLSGTPTGTSTDANGNSTYTNGAYTISGLDAGYYLVKDKDNTLDEKYDAYTKFILRVVKNQTVTPKSDIPTVSKTINDSLNGTYTEHEDFDITDTAYYKWEGTLPADLSSFDEYYYKFTDTLPTGISTGMTIGNVTYGVKQIYIEGHDGNVIHTFIDLTDSDTANDSVEGINIAYNNKVLTVEFDDLFELYSSILSHHKIIVKYTAMVDRNALISKDVPGNPMVNKVVLEYSNNPNGDGHGITTPDEAYAFTFSITVDKYDADDVNTKLEGAEFVLYYQRIDSVDGKDVTTKHYAQVVTEEMIAAGTVINGTAVNEKNLGNIYGWTDDKSLASILDTDENGALTVGGLDSGIYYLEETKAPAGYNLMETPVQVAIHPTFTADGSALESLTYQVDSIAQTSSVVGVRNSSGSTLPVTGGVGTTMFYILGSIMVLGAVVLLITKKRMAAQN